jgi:hypothetical protein
MTQVRTYTEQQIIDMSFDEYSKQRLLQIALEHDHKAEAIDVALKEMEDKIKNSEFKEFFVFTREL